MNKKCIGIIAFSYQCFKDEVKALRQNDYYANSDFVWVSQPRDLEGLRIDRVVHGWDSFMMKDSPSELEEYAKRFCMVISPPTNPATPTNP
jgi:hypothetical protein